VVALKASSDGVVLRLMMRYPTWRFLIATTVKKKRCS